MTIKNLLLWITGLAVLTFAVFWLGLEEITASIRQANPGTMDFLNCHWFLSLGTHLLTY